MSSSNYGINNIYPKPAYISPSTVATLQTLNVTTTAQFAAFDINTSLVFMDVQSNNVYVTFDGSTPSSSNGHQLAAGFNDTWAKATATAAKFVAVSGTSIITGSP